MHTVPRMMYITRTRGSITAHFDPIRWSTATTGVTMPRYRTLTGPRDTVTNCTRLIDRNCTGARTSRIVMSTRTDCGARRGVRCCGMYSNACRHDQWSDRKLIYQKNNMGLIRLIKILMLYICFYLTNLYYQFDLLILPSDQQVMAMIYDRDREFMGSKNVNWPDWSVLLFYICNFHKSL